MDSDRAPRPGSAGIWEDCLDRVASSDWIGDLESEALEDGLEIFGRELALERFIEKRGRPGGLEARAELGESRESANRDLARRLELDARVDRGELGQELWPKRGYVNGTGPHLVSLPRPSPAMSLRISWVLF